MWKNAKTWLGFGDPVYDDPSDARITGNNMVIADNPISTRGVEHTIRGGAKDCLTGEQTTTNFHWNRLDGTGFEAKAISGLFEDDSRLYTGFDAREDIFKDLMGKDKFRYLHLATHGTVALGPGRQPAVLFSLKHPSDTAVADDGYLTMEEIFNMKVPVEMAVLSACMTGCGKEESGEGVAGLSRAFLYSGADSLVVSLWSVADTETKDLMVDFYKKLIGGMKRESALREAKMDMIKQGLHPYFWSPFVYIGVN
jgi:CHAT domain-containing protein